MHTRSVVAFLFVAASSFVAATPPACLLAAVNTQPNPADLQKICSDKSADVLSEIKKVCGSDASAATAAFAQACKDKGVTVKTGGSATKTGNGGSSNTDTSGGSGGSSSGGSGSSSSGTAATATPTDAAPRIMGGVGSVVVAAVAGVAVML